MSAQTNLVMLIAVLAVTAGIIMVLYNTTSTMTPTPQELSPAQLRVVNIIGEGINDEQISQLRVEVTTDERVRINDSLVTIRTAGGVADLRVDNQ